MDSAILSVHLQRKEVPKVTVKRFSSFHIVDMVVPGNLSITFFIDPPQKLLNFKNNVLWAFENPIDMNK